jgi:dirigent-like protein
VRVSKVAVVLLCGLLGLVAVSVAGSAVSRKQVIQLYAKTRSASLVLDTAPKDQINVGDVFVGSDTLRNAVRQFGKPVGTVVGTDRYREAWKRADVVAITATATVPGGTISCRGNADPRRSIAVISVVRGTGAFAGAKGTCEARHGPANQTLNIYRLTIP